MLIGLWETMETMAFIPRGTDLRSKANVFVLLMDKLARGPLEVARCHLPCHRPGICRWPSLGAGNKFGQSTNFPAQISSNGVGEFARLGFFGWARRVPCRFRSGRGQ